MIRAVIRGSETIVIGIARLVLSATSPSAGSLLAGRRLLTVGLLVVVGVPAIVLTWSLALSRFWEGPARARLTYANERSMGVEIVDAQARYLGMIHYKADPKLDYVEPQDIERASDQLQEKIEAYQIRPDHKTIHLTPDEVPPYFWKCLVYLEDRWMGEWWRNPAGIDFVTAFKIPFNGDGGSTVPMMISRHMRKTLPSPNEPVQAKVWRKFAEWSEAPAMWRMLGGSKDKAGLRTWAAQHVVLLTNLGGSAPDIISDVYGVETAGRVLFGRTVDQLTPAEQMMLAAAYRRPLVPFRPVIGSPEDPNLTSAFERATRAVGRWKDVADRALVCASDKSHVAPASERAAIRTAIEGMGKAPPRIAIDPDLLASASNLVKPARQATFTLRLEHPYSRLRTVLPRPHRRFVVDLLTDRFGNGWRDQVRRLALTVDMAADLVFQRKMGEAWETFERENSAGWLLAPASAGSMGYLVVAADDKGRIVRFYEGGAARQDDSNNVIPRYEGGSARYVGRWAGADADDVGRKCPPALKAVPAGTLCPFGMRSGPYPRYGRDVASIGKVLASLALADAGAGASEAAVKAFAQSDSLAVERLLNANVRPDRLLQLLAAFDMTRPDAETPLASAVSRGFVRATPRAVHRLMAVALAVARGRFDDPVYLPTLIERYDRFDAGLRTASEHRAPDDVDRPIVPASLFKPADQAAMSRYVRTTLSAPVCGGGTLRTLSSWCPGGGKGVALHIAKSGTRAAGARADNHIETVDIWIAGGVVMDDGRAFTYVVLAGTDQPRLPFHSSNLNANSAAKVVDALLEDLVAPKEVKAVETASIAPASSSSPKTTP